MPWYNLKTYLRDHGGPGRLTEEIAIEATDDREAMSKAHERLQRLAPGHFLALTDVSDVQIWNGEAPSGSRI